MEAQTIYSIIDLETTGLDPLEDRIVELAILRFDGAQVLEQFSTLVNPERKIYPITTRLNGISELSVQDAPKFYEIARRIVEMTSDTILVAHQARFDYAFLKQAYGRLGYVYKRRQICTLRLSRELFPGLPSYRLSAVCRHLQIPLENPHRALGDATATLALFRHIRSHPEAGRFAALLAGEIYPSSLPPAVQQRQIDALPDDVGIYFFYDAFGRVIYAGKSKSIRKRVLSHFSNDLKSPKAREMKARIHDIGYELTGSELLALLLESDTIKRLQPRFNRSQRNVLYRYGIFAVPSDREDFMRLTIKALAEMDRAPLLGFRSKKEAQAYLERLVDRYQLCQKLSGLDKHQGPCFRYHLKQCRGACAGQENPVSYNARVREAFRMFNYPHADFAILGAGRHPQERSLVLVEGGVYQGFGYLTLPLRKTALPYFRRAITPRTDNQDVRRIINAYLNKNQTDDVILL